MWVLKIYSSSQQKNSINNSALVVNAAAVAIAHERSSSQILQGGEQLVAKQPIELGLQVRAAATVNTIITADATAKNTTTTTINDNNLQLL